MDLIFCFLLYKIVIVKNSGGGVKPMREGEIFISKIEFAEDNKVMVRVLYDHKMIRGSKHKNSESLCFTNRIPLPAF